MVGGHFRGFKLRARCCSVVQKAPKLFEAAFYKDHMGGCQNEGPFLNHRCRIIIGTQKGTIILTTTHILTSPMIL